MTHQLTPAEALALLMSHADYQRDGADRTEPVGIAIPGEVLVQCRHALRRVEPPGEKLRAVSASGEPLHGVDGAALHFGYSEQV